MDKLISSLKKKKALKSPKITAALKKIDRKNFVPKESQDIAYEDIALPIGLGQTISQPHTVVFMLELLQLKGGEKVMDVGYGSGWQTTLMAEMVGKNGSVYAIERVPTICELGRNNVYKYKALKDRVSFFCQDASWGLPEESIKIKGFNAIIAAAEVERVPRAWRDQLKTGGRLIYPKGGSLIKEVKRGANKFSHKEYPGFVFVPFVTE